MRDNKRKHRKTPSPILFSMEINGKKYSKLSSKQVNKIIRSTLSKLDKDKS